MPQFHSLLSSAVPAPSKAVTFTAEPIDKTDQKTRLRLKVEAAFVLVGESGYSDATRATEAAMAERYPAPTKPDEPAVRAPASARGLEYIYQVLARALRTPEDESIPTFRTATEAKGAISPATAGQLFAAYEEWDAAEHPDIYTDAGKALARLQEEAAKKSAGEANTSPSA